MGLEISYTMELLVGNRDNCETVTCSFACKKEAKLSSAVNSAASTFVLNVFSLDWVHAMYLGSVLYGLNGID